MKANQCPAHPVFSRRAAIQAGAIGLLGLGTNHLQRLRASEASTARAKQVVFIFLSGGLGQHDSFDMKPQAPEEVRGEFRPIATRTPGIQICEHLPRLAALSDKWSLVRSLTHPYNEHSEGHMVMLTGRSQLPRGFNPSGPEPNDHPAIPSVVAAAVRPTHNLPPAIVLPERLIHRTGRTIPGQFGGVMGRNRDPFFMECCRYNPKSYGAWPQYGFDHQNGSADGNDLSFLSPNLTLPEGLTQDRLARRRSLMQQIEQQQRDLESLANVASFDRFQQQALSMLTDGKLTTAFDVTHADSASLDRYGRHLFGWSLLLARRLLDAGVNLIQVNLGNNETWDTHGNAFPHLKNFLLPPMDQAVAAFLEDLHLSGRLEETLVVMAGEFGRTPRVFRLPQHYELPGRDHWGAVQSVLLAGGGVPGGTVIGASDRLGAYPQSDPQRPENLAATIYQALGIPRESVWHDMLERPMPVYYGDPIPYSS